MSRSIVSALAFATASSLIYLLSNYFNSSSIPLLDRNHLIEIIIQMRKKMYSTLREIAYIANYLKITEGGIEPKKIKDIMLRDGGTGDAKLSEIQNLILEQHKTTNEIFEESCKHYSHTDVEVKLLLQKFKNDIQLALQGTIQTYYGPLPQIDEKKTIQIYKEVILRRMHIIEERMVLGSSNRECVILQSQIEIYLEEEGVYHIKESNEKVFLALLQKHYKQSSEFKWELEQLQVELEDQQVKKKKLMLTTSTEKGSMNNSKHIDLQD